MAGKGNSRYLKRLNAPKYFGVHRKENAYITKPNPGRHTLEKCVTLTLALLKLSAADTNSEAAKVIKDGKVKVNGKLIKEPKYPIGIEDILEVGGEIHKIGISKQGKIQFEKHTHKDHRLFKVVGKYKESGNRVMIRLHDGSVMLAKGEIAVNDSVMVKDGEISKRLKFESGANCAVIDGVHVGANGKIISITEGNMRKQKALVIEGASGKLETLVGNIMVTG